MELTTIRAELQIALDIASQWKESGEISEIERDIVLGKLRNSYSALCHMNVATPAPQDEEATDSEEQSIDLNAILGLSHTSQPSVSAEPVTDVDNTETTETEDTANALQSEVPTETTTEALQVDVAEEPQSEVEVSAPETKEEPTEAVASEPEVSETPTPIVAETNEPNEVVAKATEPIEAVSTSTQQPTEESETTPQVVATTNDDDIFEVMEVLPQTQAPEVAPTAEVATSNSRRTHDYESPSLFDINQIETKRKHKIVLSLYGNTPSERSTATSKPTEPTPDSRVATVSNASPVSAEPQPHETPTPVADLATGNGTHTVGDSFQGDVVRLSDVLQARASGTSVGQEVVTSIRQALCNNDLYLLARDLFDGDVEACERTIKQLDRFDDLDECMIYITEHYNWNPNSAGAKLLVDLIERKLI